MTVPGGSASSVSAPMRRRLASCIDYTLLRPEAQPGDIERLCREARQADVVAVCVNGAWVDMAVRLLNDSPVRVASVVSFPLGAGSIRGKAAETRTLVDAGAEEIDMVMSLGHLLAGDVAHVVDEIAAVVDAASGRPVKVIVETAALSREEIVEAASAVRRAGAAMVKTSTGFHPKGGATVEAASLLRSVVGDDMGVKASGGIRDVETALRMIEAGATRIGTSTLLV